MTSISSEYREARGEVIRAVANLFENYLSKPPTPNITELWNEHKTIRQMLEEISAKQEILSETDKNLKRKRTIEDVYSFLNWADHLGVKRNGVTIIECADVGGLGLVAEKDICKHDSVVKVPRHAMFSSDLAKKSAMLKKLFEKDMIVKGMANVGLALFLCGHRLKADSKWAPYINVLPDTFTTPLFYSLDELQNLKPSPVFEESLLFFRTVARQFSYYLLMISSNDFYDKSNKNYKTSSAIPLLYNSPFTVDNFTFSLYKWAVGTIATRVNMIPSAIEQSKDECPVMIPALIPVLDMANHELVVDKNFGHSITYSTESDSAEVVVSKDVSRGTFVTIFYGKRSNADHLLHNGFVPVGENPNDIYKLKISLSRSDGYFEAKQKQIAELGFDESSNSNIYLYDISSKPEPFHPSLETFARVYVAEKPELISTRNTLKKAIGFLKNRFAILERSYGAIINGVTENEKNIERLKKGELIILARARLYCEEWERKLLEN